MLFPMYCLLHFFLLCFFCFHYICATEETYESLECQWDPELKKTIPKIYYINMKQSTQRNQFIKQHLELMHANYQRINALTFNDVYFPDTVKYSWSLDGNARVKDEEIPHFSNKEFWGTYPTVNHIITGLSSNPKSNLRDLMVTLSHLEAIRHAVEEAQHTKQRYAMIIEDDIFIPFNINYHELIDSAPKDFLILQLFATNYHGLKHLINHAYANGVHWHRRNSDVPFLKLLFGACAYIIDTEKFRPILETMVYNSTWTNRYHYQIYAGRNKPCNPSICCHTRENTQEKIFIAKPPCFHSPYGFSSDMLLYTMGPTYVFTLPLVTDYRQSSFNSTRLQKHVQEVHAPVFELQRETINKIFHNEIILPSYIHKACNHSLIV